MSTEHLPVETITDYEAPVAHGVSWGDFMQHYAEHFYEWADGKVFKMSPVHEKHDKLFRYFIVLLEVYLAMGTPGQMRTEPFVMRLELGGEKKSACEPDIQVILGANVGNLKDTYMDGGADICVEIVSQESVERDYHTKRDEYARGCVGEYWNIDPIENKATFYRRDENGRYQAQALENDHYMTPKLPNLRLHVPTLWQDPLPNAVDIFTQVRQMIETAEE